MNLIYLLFALLAVAAVGIPYRISLRAKDNAELRHVQQTSSSSQTKLAASNNVDDAAATSKLAIALNVPHDGRVREAIIVDYLGQLSSPETLNRKGADLLGSRPSDYLLRTGSASVKIDRLASKRSYFSKLYDPQQNQEYYIVSLGSGAHDFFKTINANRGQTEFGQNLLPLNQVTCQTEIVSFDAY